MDNLEGIIIDEIALDGLNGVTLSRLWNLLENRTPPFPLRCDQHTKKFLWEELLSQHGSIVFYEVPAKFVQTAETAADKETEPTKKKKSSKVSKEESNKIKEMMIDDPDTKERGYCPCYKQRNNVTKKIRSDSKAKCLSLQDVADRWDERLVLVASQERRLKSLLSFIKTPDLPLIAPLYCCLEQAGRARQAGVTQVALAALFKWDLRTVFHFCKVLTNHGLAFKEKSVTGVTIYLRRFIPAPKHVMSEVGQMIVSCLADQPDRMMLRSKLLDILQTNNDKVTFKRFKKGLSDVKDENIVEAIKLPLHKVPAALRDDMPGSSIEEDEEDMEAVAKRKMGMNKVDPENVQVTLIKLVGQCKQEDRKEADEDDGDEDENGDMEDLPISEENEYPNQHINIQHPDQQQIYDFIDKHQFESRGKTLLGLCRHFGMARYRVRLVIRRFVSAGLLVPLMINRGRQREQRYFSTRGLESETVPHDLRTFYNKTKGKNSSFVDDDGAEKQSPSKLEVTLEDAGTSTSGSLSEVAIAAGEENQSQTTLAGPEIKSPAKGATQTLMSVKRQEMILKYIAKVKVTEMFEVFKHIKDSEAAEKLTSTCCRKTVFRLLSHLHEEKKLKFFIKRVPSTNERGTVVLKIVAAANVADDDPLIETTVHNALVRPIFNFKTEGLTSPCRPKPKVKKAKKRKASEKREAFNTLEIRRIMEMYGYGGKFLRAEAIHKFLWYLIYGHKQENPVWMETVDNSEFDKYSVSQTNSAGGKEPTKQKDKRNRKRNSVTTDFMKCTPDSQSGDTDKAGEAKAQPNSTNVELLERLQAIREGSHTEIGVYMDTSDPEDWRRYVPPPQFQKGRTKGWANMNDIIFSLPLSLFVKIVSMSRQVPGLTEFLQHPTKRHYPITHLPLFLIEELCRIRVKTIASIHRSLVLLSCMGLVYFSCSQLNHDKTLTSLFLCSSAFYLDTTSSAASVVKTEVKEYPRRTFTFTSWEGVELYWIDLRMTCLSTPLGIFSKKREQAKEEKKKKLPRKNERHSTLYTMCMIATSQEVPPPPPTQLPGDGRGAAGFDSSHFAFRRSNWFKMHSKNKYSFTKKPKVKMGRCAGENSHSKDLLEREPVRKKGIMVVRVAAVQHKQATAGGKGQKRKRAHHDEGPEGAKPKTAKSGGSSGTGGGKKKATKSPKSFKLSPKVVRNKHISDKVDLESIQKKVQKRVKWSSREDNLIMLCGLTQRILKEHVVSAESIRHFIQWNVIRDMLQERLVESQDKTSASVCRRFRVLMRKQTNVSNFSVWLTDLTADKSFMATLPAKDGDYEDPDVCEEIFRNLCMQIHERFEMLNKKERLAMPGSLDELHENYDIIPSTAPPAMTYSNLESCDVSSDQDIVMCILVKIVLIAMLSHHYKRRDMKELYYVLQQYDQRLLHQAVSKFKLAGFLGRSRMVEHESRNKIRALHTVPMSFQFNKTFFSVLDSHSVPRKAANDTIGLLKTFLEAYHQESQKSPGDVSVSMDLVEGNLVPLFGLLSLGVIDDSITVPESLLSLDLSAIDIKNLERRHEEEIQKDSESADSEDEDSVGGGPRDAANLRETRDKEEDSSAEVSHSEVSKMRRQCLSNSGRKTVALIQSAHDAWSKSHEGRTESQPQSLKSGMASLIPRLLTSERQNQTDDSGSMTEVEVSSRGSAEDEIGEATPFAFFLDHDYIAPRVTVNAGSCGEGSRVWDQAGAVAVEMAGDNSTSSPHVFAPSEQGQERKEMSSSSADASQDVAEHPILKTDSFFTWLTMQGLQTESYSKKPQSIHEELRVKNFSLTMTPSPAFMASIQRLLGNQTEQASPLFTKGASKEAPGPKSADQPTLARETSRDPMDGGRTAPSFREAANVGENLEQTEMAFHTLAEVISARCGTLQAFAPTNWKRNLFPREDYCIRESRRSLEEVSRGHQHEKLMRSLYTLILNAGRFGMTMNKLLMASGQHWPQGKDRVLRCLRVLVREQLVLEVGSTVLRLVALEHAAKWLVKSVQKTSPVSQQAISHHESWQSPRGQKLTEPSTGAGGDNDLNQEKEGRVTESPTLTQEVTSVDNCHSVCSTDVRLSNCESEAEKICERSDVNTSEKPPADGVDLSTDEVMEIVPKESTIIVGREVGNAVTGRGGDQGSSGRDVETSQVASGEETRNPRCSQSLVEGTKRKGAEPNADLPTASELPLHESQRHVTFLSHIWTNIDGSVNKTSLSMMTTSLGLLIMSQPGIKETDIFHYFSKVMDPVECLHLIKILLNAGVISRHTTFTSSRANPFQQLSSTKPTPAPYYHPTAQALPNLALLRENFQKPT
ncbi:general transcription factor 3C polypeptide 1-like [Diadema setosum]|uniref:general transcription factor 3C polypeptide 1-like n=1 Tax=Diadema setosum TaxID=31175 RepID=UPI003B3A74BA